MVPRYWEDFVAAMSAEVPWFLRREQQDDLVAAMDAAVRARRPAAVEAPTGSGKTFAALMVAQAAPDRVVISTATRALQAQYARDIAFLRDVGVLTCDAVVLDGRRRWLCQHALGEAISGPLQESGKRVLRKLRKALKGHDGRLVRDELPVQVPDWLWDRVCGDSDRCRAAGCSAAGCAYLAERDRARAAQIVVVNHAVLLADASIKNGSAVSWGRRSPDAEEAVNPAVLGPYRYLFVDEAHALESAAEAFGERRVSVRGIQNLASRAGKLPYSGTASAALLDAAAAVAEVSADLPQGCLLDPADDGPVLLDAAESARSAARSLSGDGESEAVAGACRGLADRLRDVDAALRTGRDGLGLRAVSCEKGAVVSQLVDAGAWLRPNLWDQVCAVLVSGTLRVPGRPGFVVERLGLPVPVVPLPPVFDYAAQRLVYITPRADGGGGARSGEEDVEELVELLDASSGRALVLFSANQDLRFVHDRLEGRVPFRVLGQGVTLAEGTRKSGPSGRAAMPNSELARQFHGDTHSVLLATRSFFEGVDFPGDSCSLVVVMRFPNLRPDDALVLARRREIERAGGNAWSEYQEPAMQLVWLQAAGRAIRRVDDRGVVAVLDPRAGSKAYAKRALLGLRPSDFTMSVGDVRDFLGVPSATLV